MTHWCGTNAYFEWIDHPGDPLGYVFTAIDFDQVKSTLPLADRDPAAPDVSL